VEQILMSVVRFSEFQAKEEMTDDLQEFLASIMPIIKSSHGCESVQLLQNREDVSKFTMVEVWDSVASHQASVRNIPQEKMGKVRPLLASSPSGRYFDLIAEK
jgi:quinol monooxygenase YgiN